MDEHPPQKKVTNCHHGNMLIFTTETIRRHNFGPRRTVRRLLTWQPQSGSREKDPGAQISFFSLISLDLNPAMALPTVRWVFLHQLTQPRNPLHMPRDRPPGHSWSCEVEGINCHAHGTILLNREGKGLWSTRQQEWAVKVLCWVREDGYMRTVFERFYSY